jgi:hypothetical protein
MKVTTYAKLNRRQKSLMKPLGRVNGTTPVIVFCTGSLGVEMELTPTLAKKWEKMQHPDQRRIKNKTQMCRIKEALNRKDGFPFCHDPIAFDTRCRGVNGQHRIKAVVECNKPITCMVVFGFTPEEIRGLDDGVRRSVAEQIRAKVASEGGDNSKYTDQYVLLLTSIARLECGRRDTGKIEALDTEKKYQEALDGLGGVWHQHKRALPLPTWAALHYAYWHAPRKIHRFALNVAENARMEPGSPDHAFSKWLYELRATCRINRSNKGGSTQLLISAVTLKALKACVLNEEIESYKNLNPEPIGKKKTNLLNDEANLWFRGKTLRLTAKRVRIRKKREVVVGEKNKKAA